MTQAPVSGRFATALAMLTLFGAVAMPVTAALIWLFWDHLAPLASAGLPRAYDVTSLGAGARLAGFGLSLLGAAVQSYGLLGVRRTFLEAAAGRPLSAPAVGGFRRFAWVSLTMVFVEVVQRTGLIAIVSASDPNFRGALSIEVGTNELGGLFMGLLLVFVAHIFAEGKRASDENAAFL